MASQTSKRVDQDTGEEFYQAGQTVVASGEYELLDAQGNKTDYDIVTLDEGETFPQIHDPNVCYRMVATCLDDAGACDVNAGDSEDTE